MTFYVAKENLYFQELLKNFSKDLGPNRPTAMLDAWVHFEPVNDSIERLFNILAPYAVFEYIANNPKSRKNTLKFYHTNKSKIDTVVNNIMTDEEFDDRKSWNNLQITHSIFPLNEQKMIRDVLIYCSAEYSQQIETFIIQNFAHIAALIKSENDLQKLVKHYDIDNLDVNKLPDFEDRIRFTNFKNKSFPNLLIHSDTLTPSAYNKWYSYVFIKTYVPNLAKRLPKNLVLTNSELVPQLLAYSGAKFASSTSVQSVLEYDDIIDATFNNDIKIKTNQLIIGQKTYPIKNNPTLNDILDLILTDHLKMLTQTTQKLMYQNLKHHLENHHTKASRLTDNTKEELSNVISRYTLTSNTQSILFHLLNKHPLLSEILNIPLSKDDILIINKAMAIYNKISSDFINNDHVKNVDLIKFNTAYVQLVMTISITLLTKIESQKVITETKELIKIDKSLESKVKSLESQLQDKDKQILTLSKDASRVDSLNQQLTEAKIKIKDLEKDLDKSQQIIVQPVYHKQNIDINNVESRLNNNDVTFVGGHQSWQANMKQWAPLATYIHPDETSRSVPKTTKILVINTGYLNHGLYHHAKNDYDSLEDCQLLYLNSQSTNKNIILTELSKQIKLEN